MKSFKLVFSLVALLAIALAAQAQPYLGGANGGLVAPYTVWSGGTTNGSTALSWTVVSAYSVSGGQPQVTHLAVGSDLAGSAVTFYRVTTNTVANYASTTTSIPVTGTNGFASGDIILIRHVPGDTYEKRTLTTFTGATNLTTTVAPNQALAVGDMVYDMTTTGAQKILWGATTNTLSSAAPIAVGQRGCPLLIEINGTSGASLYGATATYSP